jgi:hypothetical protein
MKKVAMFVTVVMIVLFTLTILAEAKGGGGGRCRYQSQDMEPTDALLWTFANPNECKMDFLAYSRRVLDFTEELSEKEKGKSLIKKLLQKHVYELEGKLVDGKGLLNYFGALDYEDYYKHIVFYKKMGFITKLDNLALLKHLHNKFRDVCEYEVKVITNEADLPHNNSRNIYLMDLKENMKKIGLTFKELGISEEKLSSMAKK